MSLITATVQFDAQCVRDLLQQAKQQRRDDLWLIRSKQVVLRNPDINEDVHPLQLTGDTRIIYDEGQCPCVEVLELHNHVLKTLLSCHGDLSKWVIEVCFNDAGDFCLRLVQDESAPPPPSVATAPRRFTWMTSMYSRRLF